MPNIQPSHSHSPAILTALKALSVAYDTKGKRLYEVRLKALNDLIKQHGANIKRSLNILYGIQADGFTLNRVGMALLDYGAESELYQMLTQNAENWGKIEFQPVIGNIINKIGTGTATGITSVIDSAFYFNPASIAIAEYMQVQTAELVVNMTRQQIGGLKLILQQARKQNWLRSETKRLLDRSMTLTARETEWATNFYQKVYDESLELFTQPGATYKDAAIRARNVADRAHARKVRQLKDTRSERIVRTEISRAKTFAEEQGFQQAIDGEKIKRAKKTWRIGGVTDHWSSSTMFNGMSVDVGGSFAIYGYPSPSTMINFYGPGEINERCYLEWSVAI